MTRGLADVWQYTQAGSRGKKNKSEIEPFQRKV